MIFLFLTIVFQTNLQQKEESRLGVMQMSQFDFMNVVNLARSQKSTLNLSGFDLRKLVIISTNLEKSEIIGSDFSGMNLKQTNFKGSNLRGCNFSNCNLTSVNLQDCDLEDCNFTNAVLHKTDFSKSNLLNANLSKVKFLETTFIGSKFEKTIGLANVNLSKLDFNQSSFKDCNLTKTDLSSSNLQHCNFSNCNLSESIIVEVNLTKSRLTKSKLVNATIEDTKFGEAIFEEVSGFQNRKFISFDFSNVIFRSMKFTDSDLSNSKFMNCNFTDSNLENTILTKTNFENSQFTNCKFNNKCKFEGTNLRNISMENVDGLIGIDLFRVNLSNSKFVKTEFKICNMIETFVTNSNVIIGAVTSSSNNLISKCDLSGFNLENVDFSGFKFENVKFKSNNISKTNFENVIFDNCNLIQMNFNKENNLLNSKFSKCDFSGTIFEEIDFKLIENNLETHLLNNCQFKNVDLRELKDLSKFKGSKFDSCLFNFNQFTNETIENIQFENINLENQDLSKFTLNVEFTNTSFDGVQINPQYFGIVSSLIINNQCNTSISSELYSHTNSKSIPQLLYRGSRDGFKAQQFHSKCDNQGPTLTIIKSAEHNQIFGAFTSQSWKSSSGEWVSDPQAFIFKLSKDSTNQNYQFNKFNIKQDQKQYAIYNNTNYLPTFGSGHDITISNDCNLNNLDNSSYSNFGYSYELPNGYQQYGNEDEAYIYLAGSNSFKVSEIEVFKITQ